MILSDLKLLLSIAGGLLVAVLLSTASNWWARFAAVGSGLFFAVFATEPLVRWAGLELEHWQYLFAGLLAMTGDRLARRLMQLIDTTTVPWPWTKP